MRESIKNNEKQIKKFHREMRESSRTQNKKNSKNKSLVTTKYVTIAIIEKMNSLQFYRSTSSERYLSATLRIFSCMWLNFTNKNCASVSNSRSLSLFSGLLLSNVINLENILSKAKRIHLQISKFIILILFL